MEKRKKIFLFSTLSFLIVLLIVGVIYQKIYYKEPNIIPNKPQAPIIKEEFKTVTLKELVSYKNDYIYLDSETKEIIRSVNYNEEYIIGKYGKLFTAPIKKNNEYDEEKWNTCNNYYFEWIDDDIRVTNNNTNKVDMYTKHRGYIVRDDYDSTKCRYVILVKLSDDYEEESYKILDTKDGSVIELEDNVISVNTEEGDYQSDSGVFAKKNITNLVATTKDIIDGEEVCKSGLIDYKGNYLIEPKYDGLYIYDKDIFVAETNKKFGLINSKDETILPFEYDGIELLDNYIIVIKDNILSVLDKNYNKINQTDILYDNREEFIYYLCCAETNAYTAFEDKKGNLLLQTFSSQSYFWDYDLTKEDYDKYFNFYVINSNGIEKKIKGFNDSYYDDKMISIITLKDNIITYSFLDDKYDVSTMFSLNITHPEMDYYPSTYNINRDYYSLNISYDDKDDDPDNDLYDEIFVDIENKEEVTELDTEYYYFDNGYGHARDYGKLTIYKNKEVLEEITNLRSSTYIGDYMFILSFDNKETKIVKIEFNKE